MARLRHRLTVPLVLVLLAGPLAGPGPVSGAGAPALPPGFTDELVATVAAPIALAFTPDGRLLITTQDGTLRVYRDGALLPAAALALGKRVCGDDESGLLGVAVDPAFATNGFIYLFYTMHSDAGCFDRLSRFTLSPDNVAADETVLIDGIASTGKHNGGDVQFGRDGLLYVGVGDGDGGGGPARDPATLYGKILRLTADGDIPDGNSYAGAAGARRCSLPTAARRGAGPCQEVFAMGLRNPFRLAFDPNADGTRFYINDVGEGAREEIDEGKAGADYGWPVCEGRCSEARPGLTEPVTDYGRPDGCGAITGGAFVPRGIWPAAYDGGYVFSDFDCGKLFLLTPGGKTVDFVAGQGAGVVHLVFGPSSGTQALYYSTYARGGQVHRLAYSGPAPGRGSPTARASAGVVATAAGLGGGLVRGALLLDFTP
jgi:glucose/arabinose dehydrogenase